MGNKVGKKEKMNKVHCCLNMQYIHHPTYILNNMRLNFWTLLTMVGGGGRWEGGRKRKKMGGTRGRCGSGGRDTDSDKILTGRTNEGITRKNKNKIYMDS